MKILVSIQGTILMHRSGLGRTQEERVRQVKKAESSIFDWVSYVPIGHPADKIRVWKDQGAVIAYLSARKTVEDVTADANVLKTHGFPVGTVYSRKGTEGYWDVVERIQPDILVEHDCESNGGEGKMTFPRIRPELRGKLKSVVVSEFGGIDHLPDEISALLFYQDRPQAAEAARREPEATENELKYAVAAYLDPATTETVRKYWDHMKSTYAALGIRPHISLASFENVDVSALESVIKEFAQEHHKFRVDMPSIGSFLTAKRVIFLAPASTPGLMDFHSDLYRRLRKRGMVFDPLYGPGRWVPHCTLDMDLDVKEYSRKMALCGDFDPIRKAAIESVGVIEYFPVKELCRYELAALI
jgi:2'-5' RNA ligase